MSIHPIHRPEAVYGQPEIHTPYPAEPLNYPPYFHNPDDDPDRESLTGETKGDETSAEDKAMSVGLHTLLFQFQHDVNFFCLRKLRSAILYWIRSG